MSGTDAACAADRGIRAKIHRVMYSFDGGGEESGHYMLSSTAQVSAGPCSVEAGSNASDSSDAEPDGDDDDDDDDDD
eukprot:3678993-Rhodomonas_salina.1